jgi:hypothetical protein
VAAHLQLADGLLEHLVALVLKHVGHFVAVPLLHVRMSTCHSETIMCSIIATGANIMHAHATRVVLYDACARHEGRVI